MYGQESTHEFLGPSVPSSFWGRAVPWACHRSQEDGSPKQTSEVASRLCLDSTENTWVSDKIRYDQSSSERVVETWKRYPEEGSATAKQIHTWDGYRLTSSYRIVASSLHIWDMALFLWLSWYGLSYMINMISHTHTHYHVHTLAHRVYHGPDVRGHGSCSQPNNPIGHEPLQS